MDKDVGTAIGVTADEVASSGLEGNKTAVTADAGGNADAIPLVAAAVYGDAAGDSCLSVVDEDVGSAIGVTADEVAGSGEEGDKTAVTADSRGKAAAIPLCAAAAHRDALRRPRLPVVDKDIGNAIGVTADEVVGIGVEGDKTAVAADAGLTAAAIPLCAAAVHRDALRRPRLSVVDKDVGTAIGVTADEVVGRGGEGDKTAVIADAGVNAAAIPLCAAAVNGDALNVAGGGAGCQQPQQQEHESQRANAHYLFYILLAYSFVCHDCFLLWFNTRFIGCGRWWGKRPFFNPLPHPIQLLLRFVCFALGEIELPSKIVPISNGQRYFDRTDKRGSPCLAN